MCNNGPDGIFSFISMSDMNNLRKFVTSIVYVIKKTVELASKSPWLNGKASGHVSIEIKTIGAGMLGEQGGNSR